MLEQLAGLRYTSGDRNPVRNPKGSNEARKSSPSRILLKKGNMPLELQIIRASEFIRLGAHGRHDLATSRELLRALAAACRKRGIHRALLDLRDIHPGPIPMLSRSDLLALVNTFREVGFSEDQRLAVLYTEDPHRRARMFAFLSNLRGWNVKASKDFEESLLWLSEGQGDEVKKKSRGREIPVRKPRGRKPVTDENVPLRVKRKAVRTQLSLITAG